MINELLLKQVAILSAIAGAGLGLLSLIPFINIFSITILVICLAAGILVYMKRENLIGIFDMREGAILGSVVGFVSFIGASVVYIPINLVLGLIPIPLLQSHFFFKYFFNSFGSFVVLVMLIFFVALLSALMNAFAGLATSYVYELLTGLKKESNDSVDFEIK
ncbi:MAG: hypothetical protein ACI4SM_02850 [Candidatus Gastranaerophilaceae bacterium]